MKKCAYFKDLILTGYIDGELGKDPAGSIEDHLLDCHDCRAFFKEVKNSAVLPASVYQPVPAGLWDAIKERIEEKNQATDPVGDFISTLKGLMVLPKLVPVFVSVVLMFLVGSASLNTIQVGRAQDSDQGEYLVSLLSSTDASVSSDNNDMATPVEHYFL